MSPQYQNSTSSDITIEGVRIPAKSTKECYRFLNSLPDGITLLSISPNYNPLLYSADFTGNSGSETCTFPTTTDDFMVNLRCHGGSVEVAFNDASVTPKLTLLNGESVGFGVLNLSINKLIITYLEASSDLKVDIYRSGSMTFKQS